MSFLPEEELRGASSLNLAPMIDFLFLMVVFFASLAVTRAATRETDIQLVQLEAPSDKAVAPSNKKIITITISGDGEYTWVTDIHDYPMHGPSAVKNELTLQHKRGLLPRNKKETEVLLKIDSAAPWDSVAPLIFAIRQAEFKARPVYEPIENTKISPSGV